MNRLDVLNSAATHSWVANNVDMKQLNRLLEQTYFKPTIAPTDSMSISTSTISSVASSLTLASNPYAHERQSPAPMAIGGPNIMSSSLSSPEVTIRSTVDMRVERLNSALSDKDNLSSARANLPVNGLNRLSHSHNYGPNMQDNSSSIPIHSHVNSSPLDYSLRSRFSPAPLSSTILVASGSVDSTNPLSSFKGNALLNNSTSASTSASASASSSPPLPSSAALPLDRPSAFLQLFESELERVCRFVINQCVELTDRFRRLESELQTLGRRPSLPMTASVSSKSSSSIPLPDSALDDDDADDVDADAIEMTSLASPVGSFHSSLSSQSDLKASFLDMYRQLMSLQSFADGNYNQFAKILRKFDRLPQNSSVSPNAYHRYTTLLQNSEIARKTNLTELISSVEYSFANHFSDGNTSVARIILLGKQKPETDWKIFDLGLRFGFMILLLIWVCWDCIVDSRLRPSEHNLWIDSILPIYRGVGAAIFLGWCFGILLYVLTKYKINFVVVFDLEARQVPRYSLIFEQCTVMSIFYLANFLIYFKILRNDFPAWVPSTYFPIALFVYLIIKIFPWAMSADKRMVWWRGVGHVLLAPFGRVDFFTGYVGDVITSLVRVINDLAYAACYTLSADWWHDLTPDQERPETCLHSVYFKKFILPLLSALPLWFRFMQCLRRFVDTRQRWPHLGNAGKYALAHTVVLFGVFHSKIHNEMDTYRILWILSLALSTVYAFLWDVYKDWGLGHSRFKFLRDRMIFEKPLLYYTCIAADLFLRFAWTLTLLPYGGDSPLPEDFMLYLQPLLAVAEICRRTMWSCLRLEFEHVNNANAYRRLENPPSHPIEEESEQARRSGWRIVVEVVTLALLVLTIGFVAALTAN